MKLAFALFVSLLSAAVVAAPSVQNVSVDCSKAPNVKVTYKLTDDAVVTVKFLNNGVEIPAEKTTRLVGDVCRKVKATGEGEVRTLYWASDLEEWAEADIRTFASLTCEVTAWATNAPPIYMVADLETKSNVTFYASKTAVPGGITNDIYKTKKMIFRKIPAKEVVWNMACSARTSDGCPDAVEHAVVLSDDYYIGIYQVTQKQNSLGAGNNGYYGLTFTDSDVRPCAGISYANIMGSSTAMSPTDGSWIGKFRAHTGIESLNLPTEAQWEYACRALTTTMWYNGDKWGDNGSAKISWTSSNLAKEDGDKGSRTYPQKVGTRDPNSWDLYDMAGNVFEYCLDWYDAYAFTDKDEAVRDPLQTVQPSSNNRVRRGGGFSNDYRYGNTSWRTSVSYTSSGYDNGYRMVSAAIAY